MRKVTRIFFALAFSFALCFLCFGYAQLSVPLTVDGRAAVGMQEGVFIWDAAVISGADATVNKYIQTSLDSTVRLEKNESSTVTLRVKLYNNSNNTYAYQGVRYLPENYGNPSIGFRVSDGKPYVDAWEYIDLEITFFYSEYTSGVSNELASLLNFSFGIIEKQNTAVIDGNSSDNLASISDGKTNYDGSNTQNRWTNWSSESSGLGQPAAISIVWNEDMQLDGIKLYHFIDAGSGGAANGWRGSCDFPNAVKIYYFDAESDAYVELETVSTTNYKNAARTSQGVYSMTIDGAKVTVDYAYFGTPPITTYSFDRVTTRAVKIVLEAKENYFVGLMELELFNGNDNILSK